jgi:hypothetical protein
MADGVSVSLSHVAVRDSRVDEFIAVSLVSQALIELQCVRLSVQEEMVDASQIGGCFDSCDQQFANPKTSIRPAHGDATNFGRRAVIPEHNARCPDRSAISQRHQMKRLAIILIALQIGRNVLFADKDLFSDPKTLFQV